MAAKDPSPDEDLEGASRSSSPESKHGSGGVALDSPPPKFGDASSEGRASKSPSPESDDASSEGAASKSPSPKPKSGKRKCPTSEKGPELEIDVEAPVPPSKKALRKAKRAKLSSTDAKATKPATEDATVTGDALLKPAEEESRADKTGTPREQAIAATTLYRDGWRIDGFTKQRSEWSIWIGNLPHEKSKWELCHFFNQDDYEANQIANRSNPFDDMGGCENITRIYMPGPKITSQQEPRKRNQGWAYVDFDTKDAYVKALGLSEKLFGGRKVLIKDAKSFLGRPDKIKEEAEKPLTSGSKPPSKRIFLGNLHFDTTEQDVREHFTQVQAPKEVKLATFEDSGKCRGFGWVQFKDVEAATIAVRGWIGIKQEPDVNYNNEGHNHFAEATKRNEELRAERTKPRRLYINKLKGNELRLEFAEDQKVRYRQRNGKLVAKYGVVTNGKRLDACKIKPGAAHAAAPRFQGSIVAGQGKKTSLS